MKIISNISLNKSKKTYVVLSILALIFGVLLHFAYEYFGNSFLIGLFSPVNESIWEHLKMVLVPITMFGIILEIINFNDVKINLTFWYSIFKSILIGACVIIFGHYAFEALFNKGTVIFDIILYIFSMVICFIYIYKKNYKDNMGRDKNTLGILLLCILFLIFIVCTIVPPPFKLFEDPITNTFGIYMLIK